MLSRYTFDDLVHSLMRIHERVYKLEYKVAVLEGRLGNPPSKAELAELRGQIDAIGKQFDAPSHDEPQGR